MRPARSTSTLPSAGASSSLKPPAEAIWASAAAPGSRFPRSYALTTDLGMPARRASSACLSPARARISAISCWVAVLDSTP
jgi:hypothetical protein